MTTPNDSGKHEDDDFRAALAAMQRAAEVARERARRGRGVLVTWRDGRIVDEPVASVTKHDARHS